MELPNDLAANVRIVEGHDAGDPFAPRTHLYEDWEGFVLRTPPRVGAIP